jgi:nucleotide-binding universal stress UspA family protein
LLFPVVQGDPGPLLVDIANKEQADIMVLGAYGTGPASSCSSHNSRRSVIMNNMLSSS